MEKVVSELKSRWYTKVDNLILTVYYGKPSNDDKYEDCEIYTDYVRSYHNFDYNDFNLQHHKTWCESPMSRIVIDRMNLWYMYILKNNHCAKYCAKSIKYDYYVSLYLNLLFYGYAGIKQSSNMYSNINKKLGQLRNQHREYIHNDYLTTKHLMMEMREKVNAFFHFLIQLCISLQRQKKHKLNKSMWIHQIASYL